MSLDTAPRPAFQQVIPEERPRLHQRLSDDIARYRLPARANRINPRVVKEKMSKFVVERPEHQHWPQVTEPCREAVALLI